MAGEQGSGDPPAVRAVGIVADVLAVGATALNVALAAASRPWPTSSPVWWTALVVALGAGLVSVVLHLRRASRAWLATAAAALTMALATMAVVDIWFPEVDDCRRERTDDDVEVMVVWRDDELAAFCTVVAEYESPVAVVSVGEDIGGALDRRGDALPHVAIVPQPSLVRRYAGTGVTCAIDEAATEPLPPAWQAFGTADPAGSRPVDAYGAAVKGALKSVLWYRVDVVRAEEKPQEWTLQHLRDWVRAHSADDPRGVPLTFAAGSEWSIGDWFENELAARDPDLYDDLLEGRAPDWETGRVQGTIRAVLESMAELWGIDPPFAGEDEDDWPAWDELPQRVVDGEASIMFGPSFMANAIADVPGGELLVPVGFPPLAADRDGRPGAERGPQPFVVGGDFAVVLRQDGGCARADAGQDLTAWLTGSEALRLWSDADPGFLSPSDNSPHASPDSDDEVRRFLTVQLRGPADSQDDLLRFDLSDEQLGLAEDGDPRAVWQVLQRFYAAIAADPAAHKTCAVNWALLRLGDAYERGELDDEPGPCGL